MMQSVRWVSLDGVRPTSGPASFFKMAMPQMEAWTPTSADGVEIDIRGDKYNEKCGIFGCWV